MNGHVLGINLQHDYDQAFEYLSKEENLPNWAINFIKSIKLLRSDIYEVETPFGKSLFKLQADYDTGLIDHIFNPGSEKESKAFSRLVRTGIDSCFYTFLLVLPPMPDSEVKKALKGMAEELESISNKISEQLKLSGAE